MAGKCGGVIEGVVFTSTLELNFLITVLVEAAEGFERQSRKDLAFANQAHADAGVLEAEVRAAQRGMKAKGEAYTSLALAINEALIGLTEGKVFGIDRGKLEKAIGEFAALREIEKRTLPLFLELAEKASMARLPAAGRA